MASHTTIHVSLTPELARFVEDRVASGQYRSASDVVKEALWLLEDKEPAQHADLESVRQKIAVGLEQAKRGELLDGEAVFRELLQEDEGSEDAEQKDTY